MFLAFKKNRGFIVSLAIFILLYASLTIISGWLLVGWSSPLRYIYMISFELLFVGVAYDITEILLSLLVSPQYIPRLSRLNRYPKVAILVTVCDDVRQNLWPQLNQHYPNCDVFILDDSQTASQKKLVDKSGYTVIRRATRKGYKAGNLNHWLDIYGKEYSYFVILDSDSWIEKSFVQKVLHYAEHPDNQNVAVFQSKILPQEPRSRFEQIIGKTAPLRMYILERTTSFNKTLLSWGHNQLLRTRNVLEIGGFNETITAEDTALSLALSARGFLIRLVDVVSYDTEPTNIFSYAQRTRRWAAQAIEIFRIPWTGAPLRLKLIVCYQLYGYLIHNFYFASLILMAWTLKAKNISLELIITLSKDAFIVWLLVLLVLTMVWILQMLLRILLAKKAKVSIKDYLKHTFLSVAIMCYVAFKIDVAIIQTALGRKVRFVPTNKMRASQVSFWEISKNLWFSLIVGVVTLLGIVIRNYFLLVSINSIWLALLFCAPFILAYTHKD